jgi:phage terminase large subunit-like protein
MRADGKWAASRCGLAVPRQNGKNGVIEMRELYGMITLGEKFLHTAHEVKTARKAFLRLASFFEDGKNYPELAAMVKEIRKTNGQEAVVLHNGGSVEFVARSKGSGRGFSVDILVMDEAQELSEESLEALGFTTSASPNYQHIFTGTPPGPKANGEVFTRIRTNGNAGDDLRLAWLEWSCQPKSVDDEIDLDDRRNWASVNPALGYRLAWDTLEDERASFSDEGFSRERLGMWGAGASTAIIPAAVWARGADGSSEVTDTLAFAIDADSDGERASISVAGMRKDGKYHVEVTDNSPGTDWVSDRIRALVAQWQPCALVANGPAAALLPELDDKIPVLVVGTTEFAVASLAFKNLAVAGNIRHLNQPVLNVALDVARRRPSGDSWILSRRDSAADITPLVSAALALYGFMVGRPKRRPKSRKVLVL